MDPPIEQSKPLQSEAQRNISGLPKEGKQETVFTKVVDENGLPRLVYHGTTAQFDQFDATRISSNEYGKGIFFTEDRTRADIYAANLYVGPKKAGFIREAYLDIRHPLNVTPKTPISDFLKNALVKMAKTYPGKVRELQNAPFPIPDLSSVTQSKEAVEILRSVLSDDELTELIKSGGYDGVVSGSPEEREWIALNVDQIHETKILTPTLPEQPVVMKPEAEIPQRPQGTTEQNKLANTKVVDVSGAPLTVYHGTLNGRPNYFQQFDTQAFTRSIYGPGIYFSENPEVAKTYIQAHRGSDTGANPQIFAAKLALEHPFDFDARVDPNIQLAAQRLAQLNPAAMEKALQMQNCSSISDIRFNKQLDDFLESFFGWGDRVKVTAWLKDNGFDSFTYISKAETRDRQWVVFDTRNIVEVPIDSSLATKLVSTVPTPNMHGENTQPPKTDENLAKEELATKGKTQWHRKLLQLVSTLKKR